MVKYSILLSVGIIAAVATPADAQIFSVPTSIVEHVSREANNSNATDVNATDNDTIVYGELSVFFRNAEPEPKRAAKSTRFPATLADSPAPSPIENRNQFGSNTTNAPTDNGEVPTYPMGFNPNDVGYEGPGDMRTHLWNDHGPDMSSHGITEATLMAMPMPRVQKWHNFFHGTEGMPR